jgi:hypothetical protein
VKKERNAIMEKARSKKQRRDRVAAAKSAVRKDADEPATAPAQALAEKVVEIVQEAATQVSDLAKAATVKLTRSAR